MMVSQSLPRSRAPVRMTDNTPIMRRAIPYGTMKAPPSTTDTSRFIRGDPYTQLFHTYPTLERYYTAFEKHYNVLPVLDGMAANNYVVPFVAVAVYLAVCYYGVRWMHGRPAYVLRGPLAAWNLLLAVFSTWGTARVVPHLLDKVSRMTFEETVCASAHTYYGAGACGFAVQVTRNGQHAFLDRRRCVPPSLTFALSRFPLHPPFCAALHPVQGAREPATQDGHTRALRAAPSHSAAPSLALAFFSPFCRSPSFSTPSSSF
jgi:hypothetical protein